ncbi:glycoside hydrolase family 18 protein [Backusella circina FSU 941]|nr:glycoside hydrolase family 18 protein [Backusella circina FSU 941]
MYSPKSYLRFIILTPIIVILLTIGWYQTSIDHKNFPDKNKLQFDQSYIIAGYFVSWGIYERNYNVVDLKPSQLSHVLYAFANPNSDGTVLLGDPWADTDIRFEADKTVDGVVDPWKEVDTALHGNFKQLGLLKQQHRHLKVSLSIGGWSWSGNYTQLAGKEASRKQFAKTAVDHVINLGLDGIDIDWEFPKDSQDATNYVLLLKEVREQLDDYHTHFDPSDEPFLLSVAMPCGPENYNILKLKEMSEYVDIFYLMAYDFAGAWDDVTGHQSNLYGGKTNVDQAVRGFEAAGVPSRKIVMGMPVYGRGFSKSDNTTGSSFNGVPKGSWEEGSYDYKDLPQPNAVEYYDPDTVASWSYDAKKKEFVTYDSPKVIEAKCDYIEENGLGGAMLWELTADANDKERSIVDTIYGKLGSKMIKTNNHVVYPAID